MQSQIILFLLTLNFSRMLMQSDFSQKDIERKNYKEEIDDMNDTPSPEWIRYQQERHQHPIIETKSQSETKTNKKFKQRPEETTGRYKSNHQPLETEHEESFNENPTESNKNNESIGNAVEFPSIQGFIDFLKSLKQTWMNNSLLRIDDKIKSLQRLKDSLLKTIGKKML